MAAAPRGGILDHDTPIATWLSNHPYVVFLWVAFLIFGPLTGVFFLHDAYGVGMSFVAGLVGGAGSAFIVTVNRILGAY